MKSYQALSLLVWIGAILVHVADAASVGKPNCGGTSSSKTIQLLSPNNPPRECVYHIKAFSSYVCQLRIDFAMTLAQPSLVTHGAGLTTVECLNDQFDVFGIKLCGIETNQHIYVPFNRSNGVTNVDLKLALANRAGASGLPTPTWDMLVTQLECPAGAAIRSQNFDTEPIIEARAITDGFFVAPPGCLQYYPHASGVVTSFNFNNGAGIFPSNLNYAICFRRRTVNSALDLRTNKLRLSPMSGSAQNLQTDNDCYSSSALINTGDYLMVPEATILSRSQRATYFCGGAQDISIRSSSPGPLLVLFKSGSAAKATVAGFSLTYNVW